MKGKRSGNEYDPLIQNVLPYKNFSDKDKADVYHSVNGIKPYNHKIALAMCLNCIIGTGCFGIPYAFKQTGLVLTSIFLLLGGLFSMISMNYTLESMARADGVITAESHHLPTNQLSYRKIDFSTIGKIFCGKKGQISTQLVIGLYSVGTLWAYASVFSSSIASIVFTYIFNSECNVFDSQASSKCENFYYVAMTLYAIIVLTLILMQLGDQAMIQIFLTAYRGLAFFTMITTLLIKVIVDGHFTFTRASDIGAFDFQQFGLGFGPCLLALTCHHNMPDILQPLKTKADARYVTFTSVAISCVLFLLLGFLGAIAFDDVNPLVSLNWHSYTGCGNGWDTCNGTSIGVIVQLIVLFFPVVNVTSVYPLVALALGDNLYVSLPTQFIDFVGRNASKPICRLVVSIIPLIFATLFKRLDILFTISGLFGFVISFTLPFVFEAASIHYCVKQWKTYTAAETSSDFWGSNFPTAVALVVISAIVTGSAIATLEIS